MTLAGREEIIKTSWWPVPSSLTNISQQGLAGLLNFKLNISWNNWSGDLNCFKAAN